MTAEILIMNRNAIAMAADSAVTVGNQKTYTEKKNCSCFQIILPWG